MVPLVPFRPFMGLKNGFDIFKRCSDLKVPRCELLGYFSGFTAEKIDRSRRSILPGQEIYSQTCIKRSSLGNGQVTVIYRVTAVHRFPLNFSRSK